MAGIGAVAIAVDGAVRCGAAVPKLKLPQPTAAAENGPNPHRSKKSSGIGAVAVAGAVRCGAEIKVSAVNGWRREWPKPTQDKKSPGIGVGAVAVAAAVVEYRRGGEWYRWVVYVSAARMSALVEYRRGEWCNEWCKCVGECCRECLQEWCKGECFT